jgi:ribosome biogenesis GTPase
MKRHLSTKQLDRIQQNQKDRLDQQTVTSETAQTGLLVAHYGATVEIEDTEGKHHQCTLRQSMEPLVVGDQVRWQADQKGSGVVIAGLPRRSALVKQDRLRQLKPVAANIDRMFIVSAILPSFSAELLDQYLIAAELLKIEACIVFNKIDLLNEEELKSLTLQLQLYRDMNIPVFMISCYRPESLSALKKHLADKVSVFVGQSGVGKSSLIQSLLPTETLKVSEVSVQGHGCHTTTTSRLYHLPEGGSVIDSPGVRNFNLWEISAEELWLGFKEFRDYKGRCEFRNCQHNRLSGCILQLAVKEGKISAQRFNHFQKLLTSLGQHE